MKIKLPEKHRTVYIFAIGTILSFLFWICISVLGNMTSPPKVLSVYPQNQSKNFNPSESIIVTLDKSISEKDLKIALSPKTDGKVAKSDKKDYTFTPNNSLHTNTTYQIDVYFKNNLLSKTIFSTIQSDSDPVVAQILEQWTQDNYPLANFLPYKTEAYELYYKKEKTLAIHILDSNISEQEAKDIANTFIKENNVDPSTHEVIVVPSSTIFSTKTIENHN